jgi:hypothetical protein
MSENRVEELVRNAVAQALERQMAALRETVVREVLEELRHALSGPPTHGTSGAAALQKAVSAIQAGSTQKEILRALLDHAAQYSGRAALFVIKNGAATGWQGVSFSENDMLKDFSLDISSGLALSVMQSHVAKVGSASGLDQRFTAKFEIPKGARVALLPLLLKDKVSALIYADAGQSGFLDCDALDVLVRATSAWLEVVSQRKLAHREGGAEPETMHASAPAVNDPFASHAPLHSAKAHAIPEAAMAAAAATSGPSVAGLSPEDDDVHQKAQRFARLLMDEIKLYNQAKVSEGRKRRDLYDRLKEDIEKSRATYQKRYGSTAAAAADYFNQELIRSLAEDDVSLLGNNFRR